MAGTDYSFTEADVLTPAECYFGEVNAEVWQTWGGESAERGRKLAAQIAFSIAYRKDHEPKR